MDKIAEYEKLIEDVCNCKICHGVQSSKGTSVEGCDNQQCVNLWNYWQGDLNAKIMLIGQDYGNLGGQAAKRKNAENYSVEEHKKHIPWLCQKNGNPVDEKYIKSQWSTTSRRLWELFKVTYNIDISQAHKLYFTNLCACYRTGKESGDEYFNVEWLNNCSSFIIRLIKIIKPEIIIIMGKKAFDAFREIKIGEKNIVISCYEEVDSKVGYKPTDFARDVEAIHQIEIDGYTAKVCPIYHTAYSASNRKSKEIEDWKRMLKDIPDKDRFMKEL